MVDERRLEYLRRMGIDLWVPRRAQAEPESTAAAEAEWPVPEGKEAASPVVPADWPALRAEVAACRLCKLCDGRTQTVFGVGNPDARVMVVGEAPGAEEDRRGEPFVGRAGKLLDNMLRAVDLPRDSVYIANILKCRPPNNRDPQPDEVAACEPYLQRQLEWVRPDVVLAVGRIAAQNLLKTDSPLGRLRGRLHSYGPEQVPVVVTYHPAYLLRSPKDKAGAWQDLQQVRRLLSQ